MNYILYRSGSVSYTLFSHNETEQCFDIHERILDYFNEEFDYREVANTNELTDMAIALFTCKLVMLAVLEVVTEVRKVIFRGKTRTMTN